jgi:DNA-binding transcriptional regulator YiaG
MTIIKRFRKRHKLSQERLADLMSTKKYKIYQSDISDWENAKRHVPIRAAKRFIKVTVDAGEYLDFNAIYKE